MEVFECKYCGHRFLVARDHVDHEFICLKGPPKYTPVSNLDAARFNKAESPDQLNPRTALVAALEWYDEEIRAGRSIAHVIVLTGRDSPAHVGASGTRYFQAGTYRHHGQMGLCLEGTHMIRDSASD